MGEYLPYSGAHSVQEAVVALHFRSPFSSEALVRAKDRVQVELRKVFPRSGGIAGHALRIDQTDRGLVVQEPGAQRLSGFELSRVKPNATPSRILRVVESMLTVNFLDYGNWESTLKDSLGYIEAALLVRPAGDRRSHPQPTQRWKRGHRPGADGYR